MNREESGDDPGTRPNMSTWRIANSLQIAELSKNLSKNGAIRGTMPLDEPSVWNENIMRIEERLKVPSEKEEIY